jgi:hypothetical protein
MQLLTIGENMKYKLTYTSTVSAVVEVEAKSIQDAEDKFDKGEISLADAKEIGEDNFEVNSIEEVE